MWQWLIDWWRGFNDPLDVFNSDFPEDLECPDTQPTSPGALDSDLGDLHEI